MVTHAYNARTWKAEAIPGYLKSQRPACIKTLSPKFLKAYVALKLILAKYLQIIYFFQLRIYSSLKLNKAMHEGAY